MKFVLEELRNFEIVKDFFSSFEILFRKFKIFFEILFSNFLLKSQIFLTFLKPSQRGLLLSSPWGCGDAIFDEFKFLDKFDRKCMIDKKLKLYKGYIYCSSIQEVKDIAEQINPVLNKTLGKKIKLKTKRGCSEFAISYPNYKEIKTNHKEMMSYPEEWSKNSKKTT